jgi:hypothetical protein
MLEEALGPCRTATSRLEFKQARGRQNKAALILNALG